MQFIEYDNFSAFPIISYLLYVCIICVYDVFERPRNISYTYEICPKSL